MDSLRPALQATGLRAALVIADPALRVELFTALDQGARQARDRLCDGMAATCAYAAAELDPVGPVSELLEAWTALATWGDAA
jgi:hypothetical protein